MNMMKTLLVGCVALSLLSLTSASALSAGSRCTADESCAAPLSCVGNASNLRCYEKKRAGMRCGQDPFWVCASGLSCVDMTCKTVVSTAGSCNEPTDACADGLSCVGNVGNRKCFARKQRAMRCGQDPFWVCEIGLRCMDGRCVEIVDTAGRCGAPGLVCADGLSCVGRLRNLRCYQKKMLGMRCGQDPFWVCEDSLSCVDGICEFDVAGNVAMMPQRSQAPRVPLIG